MLMSISHRKSQLNKQWLKYYQQVKQFFKRLISRKQLCTIHFYYDSSGVIGSGKGKTESVFAWVNLARSSKEDCAKLFKLPNPGSARIAIKDIVIVPVEEVKRSKSLFTGKAMK